jgi:signal transduction histidine kinase/AraC-like DNA-binding protein/CheY-like chemotaxis protein/ABC-type sugar transport system substrate-binding protein
LVSNHFLQVKTPMPHTLRIGAAIDPNDSYWVQVREAAYARVDQLPLDLISISLVDYPETLSNGKQTALLEELLALELDALIVWSLPEDLVFQIPQSGTPLILLSETKIRHPFLVSPSGLDEIAQMGISYLAEELTGRSNVLVIGNRGQTGWQGSSESMFEVREAFKRHPHIVFDHIAVAGLGPYEQICSEACKAMQQIDKPIDAIFGLSDNLALAGRDAAREVDLADPLTLVVGIGGTPEALAAITAGSMTATVDIRTDELGRQAVDLAYQAAQDQPLPPHFEYHARLVTAQNIAEVATQKLVAIANLSSRAMGVRRRQQQERLTQLETSLEISRRVGSILDHRQLSYEIANLIRANYGYDRVQIFHWVEREQLLILDQAEQAQASQTSIPLTRAGVLGQALMRNEPIFIPDTERSPRFLPDPNWPDTRTRVILPIRLGGKVIGLLDLHSNQSTLRTRQELVGLQSLADQLGIAISNARLYGEALQAQATAEKADRLKTRLLANVSHELRTPLNVALGYIQAALSTPNPYSVELPSALLEDLQHVHYSAEHLLQVINDLLDLSRAEIDELDLHPEIIDTRPFLEEVFRSMADSVASQSDVVWQLQLPDRLPMIQGDPVRLRQILLNLLSNAHKFTESGQIVLGAEVAPPHLHIWVQDSGSGIPPELQERIFEPFVTVERARRRIEGIGLGLSITRRLVALHNGTMTLESQPGQGSTFHVYLPLPSLSDQPACSLQPVQPVLLWISAQAEPSAEIVQFSQRQGLEIRRLQANDDLHATLAEIQPVALAWDLVGADPADWVMIQRLRSYPQLSRAPFILYGQLESDQPALSTGLTNLVAKPASGETLLEAIAGLCPPKAVGPILIVDDDPQACETYRGVVARGLPGYLIYTANDGTAAVSVMARETPCLVILDLVMPGMDGFAVLDWMRNNKRTRQVPVLILSGRTLTFEDIQRLERHARVTFQSKDVLSEEETVASVQRMLLGSDTLPPHTSGLVKRAVAYLHQHYAHPLSRWEIAKAVGVSENYLSEIFRRELGLSPWEYLNRYRIRQAKEVLRRTNDSITSVALQVGFTDPAYFSRVFHKETGLSPSAYREEAE